MSSVEQGQQLPYNSLRDGHLMKYFSKPCNRKQLHKSGLIRCNGEIIPEPMIYEEGLRRDRERRAQELILRSLESRKEDLERHHHALCLRTLDEIEKIDRVRRVRSGKKRSDDVCCEDMIEYSMVPSGVCHRPLSALQPDAKSCWTLLPRNNGSSQRLTSAGPGRDDQLINRGQYSSWDRYENSGAHGRPQSGKNGLSPYLQPQESADFRLVAPKSRSPRKSVARRRFHRRNMSGNSKKSLQPFIPPDRKEDLGRLVMLTMKYHGDGLCLESDQLDPRDEILIEQQHCGGNTLYVFKDKLLPGTEFSFPSYRHPGFPFSLTIYVNGRTDTRLSACCEYKHRLNARLGGNNGHFAIARVKGGSPCCRCQTKYSSKSRKKSSRAVKKNQDESSDDDKNSEQESALSIYNPNEKNKLDIPVNDEEEDKEFSNFDKRTSEIQSPDSVRKGKRNQKKTPKQDENGREKDAYNHFLYDIKVPVDDDDDDDDDDNGKTAGPSGHKSPQNSPGKRKHEAKASPKHQKSTHDSSESDSSEDSQEELDKAKPRSSRSQRDSSDDESEDTDDTGS